MVDMGGRGIDDLKEIGYKIKTVSGSVEKLFIFTNLFHNVSVNTYYEEG